MVYLHTYVCKWKDEGFDPYIVLLWNIGTEVFFLITVVGVVVVIMPKNSDSLWPKFMSMIFFLLLFFLSDLRGTMNLRKVEETIVLFYVYRFIE